MTTLIKICGIQTPEMAAFCAKAGAHFIGLVFCNESPRNIEIKTAKQIAIVAKQEHIIPIAVFNDADERTIIQTCIDTEISHVQLHGNRAKRIIADLPLALHIIYVNPNEFCPLLRSEKDFLLFDSAQGGSGEVINWDDIQAPANMRFFLAGGLRADNVQQAIKTAHPYAVDVSSGVESARGIKSEQLIIEFIKKVNEVQYA